MTTQQFIDTVAERIFVRERYAESLGPWRELDTGRAQSFLDRARRAIEDVTGSPPSAPVEPVSGCVCELREQHKLIATQSEILTKQLDVAQAGIRELVSAIKGRE